MERKQQDWNKSGTYNIDNGIYHEIIHICLKKH